VETDLEPVKGLPLADASTLLYDLVLLGAAAGPVAFLSAASAIVGGVLSSVYSVPAVIVIEV
jgi:hypothetical protein